MKNYISSLVMAVALFCAVEACTSSSEPMQTKAREPASDGINTAETTAKHAQTGDATVASDNSTIVTNTIGASDKSTDSTLHPTDTEDATVETVKDSAVALVEDAVVTPDKDVVVTPSDVVAAAPTEDAATTEEPPSEAEQKFLDMIASKQTYSAATITPLYDQLDAIPSEFLIGTWKGHVFEANPTNPNNWYGKRIAPDLTAEPWLTNLPDGGVGPNSTNIFLGCPSTIQQEMFRGKISAVLVYNNQTNRDYFRKIVGDVDVRALDDIVIGYSSSQLKYFYLVRTFL